MNAENFGFKDESRGPEILIQIPDYGKPAGDQFLMPDEVSMPDENLDQRARAMIARAEAFVCTTPKEYEMGDIAVSEGKALEKRIKAIHDPICDATNKAHKTATGARKTLLDPIKRAFKIIDATLGNYKMLVDRQIAEEKLKLEEEARAQQKKHALAEAKRLKKEGAPKEVVDAVKATQHDPVEVAKPETQELYSQNSRTKDWDIEVIDKNLIPEYYKTVNEGAIRAAVRSAKGEIEIKGVKIIETFKTRRKSL